MFVLIGVCGGFSRLAASFSKNLSPQTVNWYCPDYFVTPYFLYTGVWAAKLIMLLVGIRAGGAKLWWQAPEIAELYLGLGFLIFVVINYVRLKRIVKEDEYAKT